MRTTELIETIPPVTRTPDDWAALIKGDLGRAAESIIAAGRHLVEAQAALPHGEWLPLVAKIGISADTAQKFMAISRNPAITNAEHARLLPSSWDTLYHLSRMEPDILETAIADGVVTPNTRRKDAKNLVQEQNRRTPTTARPAPEGRFATFVADPPWRYDNTASRGAAENHFPTMTVEELVDLDVVRKRAADQAHLYLWTTASHLPDAFRVMTAWGFDYKTVLVWCKPQLGMGNYFRMSTELVLFGVRGGLLTQARDIRNWFEAERGAHSAKPLQFYDLVQKASSGPYMELFSRCHARTLQNCMCSKCLLGWEVWGNQSALEMEAPRG